MREARSLFSFALTVLLSLQLHANSAIAVSDTLLANKYLQIADSLKEQKQPALAGEYYARAASQYLPGQHWEKYSHCQIWRAYMLMDIDKYREAISVLDTSITLINSILPPGNVYSFNCKVKQAVARYQLNECSTSVDSLSTAIILFLEGKDTMPEKGMGVLASAYFEMGNNLLELGKMDSAILMFKKTLAIREEIYAPENHLIIDCYNNIGIVYAYYGDYELADTYMRKTLLAREKIYGFAHPQTAWTYTNLAIMNLCLNKYEVAIDYAMKGLKSREQCLPPGHVEFGSSYSTIANIYNETGQYEESLDYNEKAIALYREIDGGDNLLIASIYNNIGDNFNKQGNHERAIRYFKKGYRILEEKYSDEAPSKHLLLAYNIADSYQVIHKIDSALYYNELAYQCFFNQVIATGKFEALADFELALYVLEQRANLFYIKFHETDSIEYLTTVQECCQNFFDLHTFYLSRASDDESKLEQQRRASSIMNLAVNTAYQLSLHKPENFSQRNVIELIEFNKSSVLSEMVDRSNPGEANLPDTISLSLQKISGEIYRMKAKRDLALKKETKSEIAVLSDSLFQLQTQQRELTEFIRTHFKEFSGSIYPDETPLDSLISLLDDRTVLINYYLADSQLYINCFDNQKEYLVVERIDSMLYKNVEAYMISLRKNRLASFSQLSNYLYKKLISPIGDIIAEKSKLVIIPDKLLYNFPFAALTEDSEIAEFTTVNYLVSQYEISFQYNLRLFMYYAQSTLSNNKMASSYLGFAPVFKDNESGSPIPVGDLNKLVISDDLSENELVRSVSFDGKFYNTLLFSEQEVKNTAKRFHQKGFESSALCFQKATKTNFMMNCKDYSIIHISSHGILNDKNPRLSGILFYPEAEDTLSTTNSALPLLTAGEIYGLDINADLVVLSSCESGLGLLIDGEGILSLSRAFTYAGARNIIYTLWKIGDENAALLMEYFFSEVLAGSTFSEALRRAQLYMIKSEKTAFPGTWAGFSLLSI